MEHGTVAADITVLVLAGGGCGGGRGGSGGGRGGGMAATVPFPPTKNIEDEL